MNKEWLEYEKLVEKLYKILNANSDTVVTHNDFIVGKDSGRKRQLDVTLKYNLPGLHLIIIVVSCKNYKKKPTIKLIDEFSGLLEDVKANKGVLICKSGFGSSILEYAKKRGIDLCTVENIQMLNVLEDLRIPFSYYKFDYVFKLNTSIQLDYNQDRNFKFEFRLKKMSFDKTYSFSISDYILEYWKLNKLDEIKEAFIKEIIIDRIYHNFNDSWYLLYNLKITIEKILEIKYQLFLPSEYFKLKHYTSQEEQRIIGFNNDIFDFDNPMWESTKPKEFESNLFFGNFLFITSNDTLTKEILDDYNFS